MLLAAVVAVFSVPFLSVGAPLPLPLPLLLPLLPFLYHFHPLVLCIFFNFIGNNRNRFMLAIRKSATANIARANHFKSTVDYLLLFFFQFITIASHSICRSLLCVSSLLPFCSRISPSRVIYATQQNLVDDFEKYCTTPRKRLKALRRLKAFSHFHTKIGSSLIFCSHTNWKMSLVEQRAFLECQLLLHCVCHLCGCLSILCSLNTLFTICPLLLLPPPLLPLFLMLLLLL